MADRENAEIVRRIILRLGLPRGSEGFVHSLVDAYIAFSGESPNLDNSMAALSWVAERANAVTASLQQGMEDAANELLQRATLEGWPTHRLQEALQDAAAFSRDRALRVGRTWAAIVANSAEATRWLSLGIQYVQIIDGGGDEACAHANGQIWTIQEFLENPIAHPNCVRRAVPMPADFVPQSVGFSIDLKAA